jgi:hypothetical protein
MVGGKTMALAVALAALLAAAPRAHAQYGRDRQPGDGVSRHMRAVRDVSCSPSSREIILAQYAMIGVMRQQHDQMQRAALMDAAEKHRRRILLAEHQQRSQMTAYPQQSRPMMNLQQTPPATTTTVQPEEKKPAQRRNYSPGVIMNLPSREELQPSVLRPALR